MENKKYKDLDQSLAQYSCHYDELRRIVFLMNDMERELRMRMEMYDLEEYSIENFKISRKEISTNTYEWSYDPL